MSRIALSLVALPLVFLTSCASTGGPSGGLIGLVSGGILGHLVDGNSNETNGRTNGVNGNNTGTNTTAGGINSSNDSNNNLLLGSTKTNSTDPVTGATTEELRNQYAVINPNGGNTTQATDFFGRNKGAIIGAASGAVAGLLTDQVRQGEVQKKYDEGYAKAKSDAVKEFYWLKRDAQKRGGDEGEPVQYRYYEVEVPAHTTSDGVFIDRHKRVIEVVE
jgi:hypothetical protein